MSSQKMLIVDDEVDYTEFIKEVSEDQGWDVTSINNSLDFASHYSVHFDIIILDLFMPEMDGIEILRFLSENKSLASLIFISGKDMNVLHSAQKLAEEYNISVLGVLQKPFRAKELDDLLASYMPKSTIPYQVRLDSSDEYPILEELNSAIENKEFFLLFQPQVNFKTKKVVGVEALLRWQHPIKGMIPPGFFIPLAEENFLITNISRFVVHEAFKQLKAWNDDGIDIQVSINISPKSFDDLDLPERISNHAKKMDVCPSNIVIEVTETALMEDVARGINILTRLRMKGFHLSIDDFGTGFSSLQQLVRVPYTELKIDQSFIRKLSEDKECNTIAEISILLAHKLGMEVVAEGIEDTKKWDMLKDMGCDRAQGYWIERPIPGDKLKDWIEKWENSNI